MGSGTSATCLNNANQLKISKRSSKFTGILVIGLFVVCFIVIIVLFSLYGGKGAVMMGKEGFEIQENFDKNNPEKNYNDLVKKIDELSAKIKKPTNDSKIVNVETKKIYPPAYRTSGTHYARGPLINKSLNGYVMARPANDENYTAPYMVKNSGFLETYQTWAYEIDGTIRSYWNSINNKLGGCLGVNGDSVFMTNKIPDCAKWTWDSNGRLTLNQSSDKVQPTKCLVPTTNSKVATETTMVGLQECNENKIIQTQQWSFNSLSK